MEVSLRCHASTPSAAVDSIVATVTRRRGSALSILYTATGAVERVRIPEVRASAFADKLWQHTCFEVFAREQNSTAYSEFNFSPSGEWAAYAFDRYREGMRRRDDVEARRIAVRRRDRTLELDAEIAAPGLSSAEPLLLAMSAVIEENDGNVSYWALEHAGDKPDFHHERAFALRLE